MSTDVRSWHDPDPPNRLQSDRYRVVNGPRSSRTLRLDFANCPVAAAGLCSALPRALPAFRLGRGCPTSAPSERGWTKSTPLEYCNGATLVTAGGIAMLVGDSLPALGLSQKHHAAVRGDPAALTFFGA